MPTHTHPRVHSYPRTLALLLFLLLSLPPAFARQNGETDLARALRRLPHVIAVETLRPDSSFREAYEIVFSEPLDHADTAKGSFPLHLWLSHADASLPMVIETEGYQVFGGTRPRELTSLLHCNQLVVEHRFFGHSRPDSLRWEYLRLKQTADDLHRVVTTFKTLYPGPWVSTGISKGGQTTLLYRFFYPNDVRASVPYVAPIPLAEEDPRIFTFLRSVGDSSTRRRIEDFQKDMLVRESEMIPRLEQYAADKKISLGIGTGVAYEYLVLEYSFSFWQWGSVRPDEIPRPGAPADTAFRHLLRVVPPTDYTDQGIAYLAPFIVQAYGELGYYRYDITDLRPFLCFVHNPTNALFVPKDARVTYDPLTMQRIHRYLQLSGNNIIFVYGQNDTWSACAMQLTGMTNAIKLVNQGGSHRSRIRDLTNGQQAQAMDSLKVWLGLPTRP